MGTYPDKHNDIMKAYDDSGGTGVHFFCERKIIVWFFVHMQINLLRVEEVAYCLARSRGRLMGGDLRRGYTRARQRDIKGTNGGQA